MEPAITESLKSASEKLNAGAVTSVQLVEACRARISERDESIHAYLEVFADAEEQAAHADEARKTGKDVGPLAGIPIAVKDNILIRGKHCSAGSKMLEPYVASYDAHVVERLREAGAVLLGRTNMDEFAMGSSTEHSAFGVTRNPLDEERVPGGSSGGSAAAVAYGGAVAALGSDTGGSIRQPASFCGVVGLKPTYGSVSRYGLIAFGSSLDQIGPVTKTVEDSALLFDAIKGGDRRDSTSLPTSSQDAPVPLSVRGAKRLGVPRSFFADGVDDGVRAAFDATLEALAKEGYEIVDIDLPSVRHALAVYYIIMFAEASSNLARFDGVRYGLQVEGADLLETYKNTRGAGFGAEVKRRIMLGTYVLSSGYYDAYYATAAAARRSIAKDFDNAFSSVDAIVTPTTPTSAYRLGEKSDPVSMYVGDLFTVPANLTGLPAISVPCGAVDTGGTKMPVGFQVTAKKHREDILFSIGRDVERVRDPRIC